MPKIEADSVAEHRELITSRLVDAAEEILRSEGIRGLTASAVGARAGVARNSIYRYVSTVTDLVGMVIQRRLIPWFAYVAKEVEGVTDPVEFLVAWTRANLFQAADGHAWLVDLTVPAGRYGTSRSRAVADEAKEDAHARSDETLIQALERLGSREPALHGAIVRAILDAGFRLLAAGHDLAHVECEVTSAVRAYAESIRTP